MAINAYTGLMGSGKSYEVVSSVIVPAVLAGRRVVTNIDGINPEAIYAYCTDVKKANVATLGPVIPISNTDVLKDGFFPDETKPDAESLVKAGDLVAIDEAWEFWSVSHKISPEHMRFFRMHRHYVDPETGLSCDVALMIQSITDLHRQLRSVIEVTFVTKKLKELGLGNRYRVEMFGGGRITKAARFGTTTTTYDKAIFPLYQSYAGGSGKERAIDARQNMLRNPKLWMTAVLFLACWIGVGMFLWRFFHPQSPEKPAANSVSLDRAPSALVNVTSELAPHPQIFSEKWRIAGRYSIAGRRYVALSDNSGRLRIEPSTMFGNTGLAIIGEIDGQQVSPWSGQKPSSRAFGAAP
ncbi:Zonular occludens toxin [Pandoraea iniqua]|uniref:zonular occludens toxin domain-containing protein n=1 Tax=Pandoraea iniqua TaxID=2508288 RepID=UPI001241BC9E|nr:zonular occludens toxin domain-containing protein [Pandoraea iniqua]VVE18466.1 Zonular occludens toxin [Pandoraea iniqua]